MDWISYVAIVGSAMLLVYGIGKAVQFRRRRRWQLVRQPYLAPPSDVRNFAPCIDVMYMKVHGAHNIGNTMWCPGYVKH